MTSFLKNLAYIAAAVLILAVPVLLTFSFCLGWDEAIQGTLCLVCLIDFIMVWILVVALRTRWNRRSKK